jgi:hypothetical protein
MNGRGWILAAGLISAWAQDSEIAQSIEVVNQTERPFRFQVVVQGRTEGSYDCPGRGEVAIGYPKERDRNQVGIVVPRELAADEPEWDELTRTLTFTVRAR